MLRKGVYSYKDIDDWGKIIEALLAEKNFHSSLNIEDITDED